MPIWPRHPLGVGAADQGPWNPWPPGRIRLGGGAQQHRAAAMSPYGAEFRRPYQPPAGVCERAAHSCSKQARWTFGGEFLRAKGRIPGPLPTPVLASALGEGAFRFCGEITDGGHHLGLSAPAT